MDKDLERQFAAQHQSKYDLLTCPFCGGLPFVEKSQRAFIGGETTHVAFVRCIECNARTGREKLADYGRTASSGKAVKKVVESWNKRAG